MSVPGGAAAAHPVSGFLASSRQSNSVVRYAGSLCRRESADMDGANKQISLMQINAHPVGPQ
jgi:hypothetical protein